MECPICYENISKSMFISHCYHTFHIHCVKKALDIKNTCPICRRTLFYSNFVKIKPKSRLSDRRGAISISHRDINTYLQHENQLTGQRWTTILNSSGSVFSSVPVWFLHN